MEHNGKRTVCPKEPSTKTSPVHEKKQGKPKNEEKKVLKETSASTAARLISEEEKLLAETSQEMTSEVKEAKDMNSSNEDWTVVNGDEAGKLEVSASSSEAGSQATQSLGKFS